MRVSYLLIAFAMTILLIACAGSGGHVKMNPETRTDSSSETLSTQETTSESLTTLPEFDEPSEAVLAERMIELKQRLASNGVPEEWFDEQTRHESFRIHSSIARYFQKAAEKQVDHDKKRDREWYFARLGVDAKIEKGKPFIKAHQSIFDRAEAKHGIHKELIAAIIGIETNFADRHQRGNFYAFNSLVSVVFTKRKKFASGKSGLIFQRRQERS
jgi:membrane-bound lytic murein transglycosylase B